MSSVGLNRQRSAAMLCTVASGYTLEPFMADAVVARPWMHYRGHIAHGTVKSVISLGIGLYAIYTSSGLRPSVCKLHRDLYLVI